MKLSFTECLTVVRICLMIPFMINDHTPVFHTDQKPDVEVVNPLGGNTKVHKLGKQQGIKLHACNTVPIHNLSVQMLVCHQEPSDKTLTGVCIVSLQTGLFYYTLGNLPPKFRSQLQAIHLLMVVKVQHIPLYGIDEVLAPVIDDLQTGKSKGASMVIINMLFYSTI